MGLTYDNVDFGAKNAYFPCKFPVKQGKWV